MTTDKDQELRSTVNTMKDVIVEGGVNLVKQYVEAATGKGELKSNNQAAREEIWGVCKELILKSSNHMKVDIESPKDIINAVASGTCTVEDGKQLMKLFTELKTIEREDKPAIGAGGGQQLTINIQSGPDPLVIDHAPVKEIENGD